MEGIAACDCGSGTEGRAVCGRGGSAPWPRAPRSQLLRGPDPAALLEALAARRPLPFVQNRAIHAWSGAAWRRRLLLAPDPKYATRPLGTGLLAVSGVSAGPTVPAPTAGSSACCCLSAAACRCPLRLPGAASRALPAAPPQPRLTTGPIPPGLCRACSLWCTGHPWARPACAWCTPRRHQRPREVCLLAAQATAATLLLPLPHAGLSILLGPPLKKILLTHHPRSVLQAASLIASLCLGSSCARKTRSLLWAWQCTRTVGWSDRGGMPEELAARPCRLHRRGPPGAPLPALCAGRA